jgi:hypothetical protein
MKTLPAIIAIALGLALALVPAVSFAAGSITFSSPAPGSSYKGTQSYTIAGTVSPAPNVADNVFITVKNPSGTTVDAASVSVTPSTGAFSYSTATGGSAYWVTGTYTITATDSYGATGTTTFSYTAVAPAPTVSGQPFQIRVIAPDQAYPGETVNIFIETTFNGTLAGNATSVSFHAHVWWVSSPNATAGTFQLLPAPSNFATGHYITSWKVPSNAAVGSVAWIHVPGSYKGYTTTGVAGVTVVTNPAAQQTALTNIQNSLTQLTNSLTGITNTLSQVTSSLSSISGALSTLQTTANNAATQAQNAATQANNAASAVSSTQTYVLVVAVLAAITLVLELAILVRKLS